MSTDQSAHAPASHAEPAPPNRLVGLLLAERHSLPLSVALHLVPGALIVAAYVFVAAPLVRAIDYPIFLAWAIALILVLTPILLGLLWLGRQRNGRYSLRGVVGYLDKPISRGRITALIAGLIVWMTVVSLALSPLDTVIYDTFFTWVSYEGAGASGTTYLEGYAHSRVVVTMVLCLPLTGFTLPLIEELYFRGFLLPRISHLGWGAPVLNTVLFSVYHFWTPWAVLSRIIFMFPAVWLVWRKQDIRVSIGMHPGTALLMATVGTVALLLGVV
ncbi:CPBP family intramembrane glutamic endopeptidase [Nocardioides sp. NPDC126508]